MKRNICILGYGNLGRAVERAILRTEDLALCAIYTRRDPTGVTSERGTEVRAAEELFSGDAGADLVINCTGSATDAASLSVRLAARYCVLDSFDDHTRLPRLLREVSAAAGTERLALLGAGWDPGLFSLFRLFGTAFFPAGEVHTFWGPGVSQGHTEALRRLPGVKDAFEITVPRPSMIRAARRGGDVGSCADCHTRLALVVPEAGADLSDLSRRIRTYPAYFEGYGTEIRYLSEEELAAERARVAFRHGGRVIATGGSGEHSFLFDAALSLGDNPTFTGTVLAAYARAALSLFDSGVRGALSVLDVPPSRLLPTLPDGIL